MFCLRMNSLTMGSIAFYLICFLGLIVLIWLVAGRGSALFCIFVGVVSASAVLLEYKFGKPVAALTSCALIISLPLFFWVKRSLDAGCKRHNKSKKRAHE